MCYALRKALLIPFPTWFRPSFNDSRNSGITVPSPPKEREPVCTMRGTSSYRCEWGAEIRVPSFRRELISDLSSCLTDVGEGRDWLPVVLSSMFLSYKFGDLEVTPRWHKGDLCGNGTVLCPYWWGWLLESSRGKTTENWPHTRLCRGRLWVLVVV